MDFNIKIILKNIGYMELTSLKLVLHSEINVIDNQERHNVDIV